MKNRYIAGDYNVICDITGFKYKRSECRIGQPGSLIAGLLVHKSEWAPRHPQLDIRAREERIGVPDARPEGRDVFIAGQGPGDKPDV